MNNFYCQKKCGEEDFSIEEWNKVFQYCIDNNLSEKEMSKILEGEPCINQCFTCVAIVGKTRLKTKTLIRRNQK